MKKVNPIATRIWLARIVFAQLRVRQSTATGCVKVLRPFGLLGSFVVVVVVIVIAGAMRLRLADFALLGRRLDHLAW